MQPGPRRSGNLYAFHTITTLRLCVLIFSAVVLQFVQLGDYIPTETSGVDIFALHQAKGTTIVLKSISDNMELRLTPPESTNTIRNTIAAGSQKEVNGDKEVRDFGMLLESLEHQQLRFYIHDNENITCPEVRQRALAGNFTWKYKWGQRFKEYALWELSYWQALEMSPLRVYDSQEADIYFISIPWGAIFTAAENSGTATRRALDTLYRTSVFQQHAEQHVTFSFIEPLFEASKVRTINGMMKMKGSDYQQLAMTSIGKDSDHWLWDELLALNIPQQGFWSGSKTAVTKRGFSLSLMGAATDTGLTLHNQRVSLEEFHNRTFHFFYHSRPTPSLYNSTQFRHAPIVARENLTQPSSVSWGVSGEQWRREFHDSKFCLMIRGDKPCSRAMYRAIRNGCIPVVVNEMLPFFAPIFRSQLNITDYAILVHEEEFLRDPAGTLNRATEMSDAELDRLLQGLHVIQRFVVPDHPESLFVEAFLAEARASFDPEYSRLEHQQYLPNEYFHRGKDGIGETVSDERS